MAFQLNITLEDGSNVTDAIWEVGTVTTVPNEKAAVAVNVYTNDRSRILQTRCYTFDYSDGDTVVAATNHLKTLSEFSEAIEI